MNKKLTIGIVGFTNNENRYFGVPTTYLQWAEQFGNPTIIMPWETDIRVDALILTGGQDILPQSYGQIPGYKTGNPNVHQQYFYDTQLEKYIKAKIPIFGICLGHQMIASFFGCQLTQHLKWHKQSRDRWETAHEVTVTNIYKKKGENWNLKVNSHHHQCVQEKDLVEELIPIAICDDKDEEMIIVEAMRHISYPICSIQWHSEEMYDSLSTAMFKTILKEAGVKENVVQ
jgi:putative glutamine amidotransferase